MSAKLPYLDRREAGRILAKYLKEHFEKPKTIVLGLARGGIPVASEIAGALKLPLDVFVVRKLGVPGHEELAMGAIASGGIQVINPEVASSLSDSNTALRNAIKQEQVILEQREQLYREGHPLIAGLRDRTIILVDDGLATGTTMSVAVQAMRRLGVERCVVAVPVGSFEACEKVGREADQVICVAKPRFFYGVGQFYEDFSQTSDEEVRTLLGEARHREDTWRS
ncbi:MAG: phosphoribosyl transferase [Verrucomicrobia bacterium]|nr:MAG: phosphoribosyl transferase [Verrucomicrobiota bacterium]